MAISRNSSAKGSFSLNAVLTPLYIRRYDHAEIFLISLCKTKLFGTKNFKLSLIGIPINSLKNWLNNEKAIFYFDAFFFTFLIKAPNYPFLYIRHDQTENFLISICKTDYIGKKNPSYL